MRWSMFAPAAWLVGSMFASTQAFAQSPGDWNAGVQVLAPDPAKPWMSQSVSSPSVVWDSVNSRYIMLFESRHIDTDANCPAGIWSIGAATSSDGLTWNVRPDPILEPTPGDGTYFSCVAAHPTAIFNPAGSGGNGTVIVHFKGEQDDLACDVATPTWGCEQYTGIGRLKIELNPGGTIDRILATNEPTIPIDQNMGYPSAVRVAGSWSVALGEFPDIFMAQGPNLNTLTLGTTPVLDASTYSSSLAWMDEEFYSPAMLCDSGALPYKMYVAGRDTDAAFNVTNAGWASATSPDALSWTLNTTPFSTWANNDEYRHLEGLNVGTGEYLLYYTERTPGTSVNNIFLQTTDAAFVPSTTGSKNCP